VKFFFLTFTVLLLGSLGFCNLRFLTFNLSVSIEIWHGILAGHSVLCGGHCKAYYFVFIRRKFQVIQIHTVLFLTA
jgi:hypothetical protein